MPKPLNKIIKILVFSDLFLHGGWGIVGPVFAIFLLENIAMGNPAQGAKIAGFASLAYWITMAALRIPIGKYLDKNHGEKDDFWFVVAGTFLAGISPFGFLLSSQPWHIYTFQIIHAIGIAMAFTSWDAIFTRHIDKGKEAFEWGLDGTIIASSVGLGGALGGILAAAIGFKLIFVMVGGLSILSSFLLLFIHKEISPKNKLLHKYRRTKLNSNK